MNNHEKQQNETGEFGERWKHLTTQHNSKNQLNPIFPEKVYRRVFWLLIAAFAAASVYEVVVKGSSLAINYIRIVISYSFVLIGQCFFNLSNSHLND